MKRNKAILLLLGLGLSSLLFSQIWIKTDAPTKTPDVNGETRIRTLAPKYNTLNMGVVLSISKLKKIQKSKAILLLLGLGLSPLLFSQIWIKTDAPTKTLDVNGEARIRTLAP